MNEDSVLTSHCLAEKLLRKF